VSHAATALALALAIGAASFIIAKSEVSKAPRMWLAKQESRAGIWLFKLVSCPFCTATWLALFATATYRPLLVHLLWPLDYVVTALAIAGVAMLPVLVIRKAVEL
jgi:hypothetical protein